MPVEATTDASVWKTTPSQASRRDLEKLPASITDRATTTETIIGRSETAAPWSPSCHVDGHAMRAVVEMVCSNRWSEPQSPALAERLVPRRKLDFDRSGVPGENQKASVQGPLNGPESPGAPIGGTEEGNDIWHMVPARVTSSTRHRYACPEWRDHPVSARSWYGHTLGDPPHQEREPIEHSR